MITVNSDGRKSLGNGLSSIAEDTNNDDYEVNGSDPIFRLIDSCGIVSILDDNGTFVLADR
jgi:hypothetical protein